MIIDLNAMLRRLALSIDNKTDIDAVKCAYRTDFELAKIKLAHMLCIDAYASDELMIYAVERQACIMVLSSKLNKQE